MKGKVEESSRPSLEEIRVIIGGSSTSQSSKFKKAYLKVVQSVQLSRRSPRARTTDEQAITFTDEDAERIHHPHDDAIVITLLIADYITRRVLVDNGSSADILYYPAFQQMRLGRDQLRPMNSPLVGWNEGTTCRYYFLISGSGGIPTTNHQGRELPCGRLFILLQRHNWKDRKSVV